jgi:hypothetical protein
VAAHCAGVLDFFLEDDQDLCGVVSALNGTVKSVAPGKIKVRQNAKERVVGLEKV